MSERCGYEEEQREILRGTHGLFVGMLNPEELKAFDYLCEKGEARREYQGVGGFMGLAKVSLKDHQP